MPRERQTTGSQEPSSPLGSFTETDTPEQLAWGLVNQPQTLTEAIPDADASAQMARDMQAETMRRAMAEREAAIAAAVAEQARQMGWPVERWQKLLAESPDVAAELVREQALEEERRERRTGTATSMSTLDAGAVAGRSQDNAYLEEVHRRMIVEQDRSERYILMVDPDRHGVSVIPKKDVVAKTAAGFTLDMKQLRVRPRAFPCSLQDAHGNPCPYRGTTQDETFTHEQVHHPQQFAARLRARQEAEERSRREREERDRAAITALLEKLAYLEERRK